jgi:hypothetical protein
MEHFPGFMKNINNKVNPSQQNTADIEGYYYEGKDDSQIAFWECHHDRISKKHTHSEMAIDDIRKAPGLPPRPT